jgi:hypothetical protein
MQNELLKEACKKAVNHQIHLGIQNGWSKETGNLYQALREHAIPNSGICRDLGRCYYAHSFDVRIEDKVYVVTYSVDSSD